MYWSNHGHVRFRVFCNVTVTVKELPHQAVLQSASLRLMGVTDEQFISEDSNVAAESKAGRLQEKLAEYLKLEERQVEIISVCWGYDSIRPWRKLDSRL
ncbi:beta-catenin binding [Homalodisca vitripennis]|nr:beta-catenin binding [Homalodisca vitripennis]